MAETLIVMQSLKMEVILGLREEDRCEDSSGMFSEHMDLDRPVRSMLCTDANELMGCKLCECCQRY